MFTKGMFRWMGCGEAAFGVGWYTPITYGAVRRWRVADHGPPPTLTTPVLFFTWREGSEPFAPGFSAGSNSSGLILSAALQYRHCHWRKEAHASRPYISPWTLFVWRPAPQRPGLAPLSRAQIWPQICIGFKEFRVAGLRNWISGGKVADKGS